MGKYYSPYLDSKTTVILVVRGYAVIVTVFCFVFCYIIPCKLCLDLCCFTSKLHPNELQKMSSFM